MSDKKNKIVTIIIVLVIVLIVGTVILVLPTLFVSKDDKQASKEPVAIEYDVDKMGDMGEYYASKFIIVDDKLYALPTDKWTNANPDYTYKDKKYVTIASNVDKLFMVTPGQSGIVSTYYTDKDKNAYYVYNIVDLENKPGATRKIDGATNVIDMYDILAYDSIAFVMLNKDNQIVAYDGDYVAYDKKNSRGANILPDGTVIELSDPVVSVIDEDRTNLSMNMTVNGKETTKRADYEMYDAIGSYKDIDYFEFKLCKDKKGNYQAGEICYKEEKKH
ncbi:MAG: hypothetical protein K5666_01765 [Bacilli bacterium]|nr:hypothetical protein [Bacilli bacterium]